MSLHPEPSTVANDPSRAQAPWAETAADCHETWAQLVEQIAQLEELIADLRSDRERHSVLTVRKLDAMLKEKRMRLKAIDVGA